MDSIQLDSVYELNGIKSMAEMLTQSRLPWADLLTLSSSENMQN